MKSKIIFSVFTLESLMMLAHRAVNYMRERKK